MPNNRRCKVNRLPISERTHASSKIIILPPHPQSLPFPQTSIQPSSSRPKAPTLDDESLSKLLSYAGPATILSSLNVCVQWRRVAMDLLSRVVRMDISKVYVVNGRRVSPPKETQVVTMLSRFPNLQTLTLSKWPYNDLMEDIAAVVCAHYFSTTLRDVEFLGVLVRGKDLVCLLQNCPSLRTLRLGDDSSINDAVLKEVARYCEKSRAARADFALDCISLNRTKNVTRVGLNLLLHAARPHTLLATRCDGIRSLTWLPSRNVPASRFSIVNCPSLASFKVNTHPEKPDVIDLNLSQCTQLSTVDFHGATLGMEYSLCLASLNLAGCRSLRNISVSAPGQAWYAFRNLEELNLYGTYGLDALYFQQTFGLAQGQCALPCLKRLTVTGCRLDVLRLIDYPNLTFVDCSGCSELAKLEIRSCWQMETLVLQGKRSPLNSVHLTLPANCIVQGRRKQWHWESHHTNQTILFP